MKLPEKAVNRIYKNNADVIVRMQRHRLVAVVRSQSSAEAYRIAAHGSDAGIWFVEITFTVPDALGVIERLALRNDLTWEPVRCFRRRMERPSKPARNLSSRPPWSWI